MHSTKSTHGLCQQCLNNGGINLLQQKKPNNCLICQKQPDLLFSQDPYCATCYIQTISSPLKSQMSSQRGHRKNKSFYRPIDKSQVKSMKNSFLSSTGKLIKKISKIFQQNQTVNDLLAFFTRKATPIGTFDWEKMVAKVTKSSNIVYIFIGKQKIIGAFHTQSINIDGQAKLEDQQAGIFFTDKYKFDLQFARVKSDLVIYSSRSKIIKFGSPNSLQITFDKGPKLTSQIVENFEFTNSFIYRP